VESTSTGGEPGAGDLLAAVAANLRRLRVASGLSLGELARRAGVAKSTVSQLEAGGGNPSIETLWALARALDVPFGRLVSEPERAVTVIRAGDGPLIAAAGAPVAVRLLASSERRTRNDLYAMTVEPGAARHAEPHLPGTLEHLVVVRGRLRVGPEGALAELRAGDYGRFPGDVPHVYEALEPGTEVVMLMAHP
jgi:transcriptional regulator with XRE-family HTH domain